jgi:hypothetical protein
VGNLVGAASSDQTVRRSSSRLQRRTVRKGAANATLPKKKPTSIVNNHRVGAVSTEKSSQAHEKNVRERAVNGLLRNQKRTRIAGCVGVASKDPRANSSFK